MRTILITAAATLALAACDMAAQDSVVVTDGTDVAVVTPEPIPTGGPAPLPMLGTWNCDMTSFTVTPGTYSTGGGATTRIVSIDRGSDFYRLHLQDGQVIRLSNFTGTSLTWQNEAQAARGSDSAPPTMVCSMA